MVLAGAAAVAFTVSAPQSAYADDLTPPPVPDNIQVDPSNKVFLVGHAIGTQNYICLPSATSPTGFAFTLFTPQATLFSDNEKQVITHFFSPNPDPSDPMGANTIRATWQDSRDTSAVWAAVATDGISTDPLFVEPGAVAWLKLVKVGTQLGPKGGDTLAGTTFIQRLNTHGGLAPSTGCASSADVGNQAHVPYTTDYYFYKSTGGRN
jgi:hypothetical protein